MRHRHRPARALSALLTLFFIFVTLWCVELSRTQNVKPPAQPLSISEEPVLEERYILWNHRDANRTREILGSKEKEMLTVAFCKTEEGHAGFYVSCASNQMSSMHVVSCHATLRRWMSRTYFYPHQPVSYLEKERRCEFAFTPSANCRFLYTTFDGGKFVVRHSCLFLKLGEKKPND